MSFRCFYCFLIAILLFTSCREKNSPVQELQNQLQHMIEDTPGSYAIAFKELNTEGHMVLINADTLFHAASTMKTPVLYELYNQQAQGKLNMTDSIPVINVFKSIVDSSLYQMDISDDSADELYQKIGDTISIYELVYEMITQSSNLATNILIEKVGANNVTESMRSIGANDIRVLRGVEDIKAFEKGLSNRTTAYDLMILFEKLGKYELVDSIASQKMLDILLHQKYNEIIPAKLPENVKVAHKTGSITRVMHDSGLIILPDGRKYVLILLSKDWESEKEAKQLLQNISLEVYNYVINSTKKAD